MNKTNTFDKQAWQTSDNTAALSLPLLRGTTNLAEPAAGITKLVLADSPVEGALLGVSSASPHEFLESYVRGDDQVLACSSAEPQPFQWQVYWRATTPDHLQAQIDLIVSLQTPTLESYPTFTSNTSLPAEELWDIKPAGAEPIEIGEATEATHCMLLRPANTEWSYAQMILPADEGRLTLTRTETGLVKLSQEMGNRFLEKGVIRRLRIRGIFLPREDDLKIAGQHFANFCAEQPPLTT